MKGTIRLSGIAYESLVNGPGIRRVSFSQECKHNCKGCLNPDTHGFSDGEKRNMDELTSEVLKNPMVEGVTFGGGDPFGRAEESAYMAKSSKENRLNVWSYAGYTFEEIINNLDKRNGWRDLLNNIDVLVDGKFDKNKMENGLRFRGSGD